MSRSQQDQFIDEDEEEELCPLCVEELDITDKNFRPCPCGYQVRIRLTLSRLLRVAHRMKRYVNSATTTLKRQ